MIPHRLRAAVTRIAAGYGLELFDLQFRRESIGWVMRVILDRHPHPDDQAGSTTVEEPVSIDDCRRVSEDLSTLLDVEPDLTGDPDRSFTLEVSSPGLDRPLRGGTDYQRFTGRLAKIVTSEPITRTLNAAMASRRTRRRVNPTAATSATAGTTTIM